MPTKAVRLSFIAALLSGHNVDVARVALTVSHALNVKPLLALPAPRG